MKKKKKLIIVLIIIALVAGFGAKTLFFPKNTLKTVNTVEAVKTNLVQSITLTGNIKAGDTHEIMLPSTQKVTEVLVEEGQEVEKNQTLIKLDTHDLETQLKKSKITLDMAKRDLTNLTAEDSTARKSLENSVSQAELALKNAKSKYEDTKTKHEQNKKLYEAGFISKAEYDASQSALNELESSVMSAEIALDNAKRALSDFDDRIYQQQKQIEMYNIDISNMQKQIADSSIKSNIKGKIVRLDAKENQYPSAGSSIIIQDLSKFILELKANQYDAVELKIGQKAIVSVKGIDKNYEGHITKIGEYANVEMVNTSKETVVPAEITIENGDEQIKAGYEGEAEVILTEKPDCIAVNYEAIQTDEKGSKYIFVVEDGIAKKREIETGLETDFEMEILSGLKEGEKYIISPPQGLQDGEAVTTTGGM